MTHHPNRREFLGAALAAGTPAGLPRAPRGKYLEAARQFLDTLTEKGTDRYGNKNTPLFCLVLDPETYSPPRPPAKVDSDYANGLRHLYRDYGYYWKSHLHSAGPIYDQGTVRALYALSEATRDRKYARAAERLLDFFLANMVSPKTGIFGWGEHIFWNVFLDAVIGGAFSVRGTPQGMFGHELERWTTIYDLTWERDRGKTLTEIEGIWKYKVLDQETAINNRHSDYFEGPMAKDALTFIKHSGLFAHAFAFLYTKTGEKKHLDWARKSSDLFWRYRNPDTNLVRGCIQRKDEPVAPAELAQLILFLLRAYQWHPEQRFAEYAVAYLDAYRKYFEIGETARFRDVVGTDGADKKPGQVAEYWEGPLRMAKAAVLAYSLTGHRPALEMAARIVDRYTPDMSFSSVVQRSLVSDEIEARSCGLSTAIDLYEVTADQKYLKKAQSLAADAIQKFLYRGLFVSSMPLQPEGDKSLRTRVYDARTAAGVLALNLIRLQRDTAATEARRFRKFDRLERIYD